MEESAYRPFDQTDYYAAKQAFKNMVKLKIITAADAARWLEKLKEATKQ